MAASGREAAPQDGLSGACPVRGGLGGCACVAPGSSASCAVRDCTESISGASSCDSSEARRPLHADLSARIEANGAGDEFHMAKSKHKTQGHVGVIHH